jgi:sugar (pentulose or hexulose) kinase
MESSGVSLLVLLNELVSDRPLPDRIMATGGGAESEVWRQIKASITGAKILTTYIEEPACYGACLNAASGELNMKLEHLIKNWINVKKSVGPEIPDRKFYLDWIQTLDLIKYR